jgi:anti-sigma factor RsiW
MEDEAPLDLELHGYVDGALDDDAMERIERYLSRHPEVAARVRAYMQHKTDLIEHARTLPPQPRSATTNRLARQLGRRLRRQAFFPWPRVAVIAAIFGAGWLAHVAYLPLVSGPPYTDEIVRAHLLTTLDPAEVMALSPDRLSKLFMRVGEAERLPDLRSLGFEPIGAQLLPSDEGAVLHVPYRDGIGTTLSYFVLHASEDEEIPRHILHRQGITLVYWQHEHARYALAGPLTDEQVIHIAGLVEPVAAHPP